MFIKFKLLPLVNSDKIVEIITGEYKIENNNSIDFLFNWEHICIEFVVELYCITLKFY